MISSFAYQHQGLYAYEPVIKLEKTMLISEYDGWIMSLKSEGHINRKPSFAFTHRMIYVEVIVIGFTTINQARRTLENIMWDNKKMFHTAGITDLMTYKDFQDRNDVDIPF